MTISLILLAEDLSITASILTSIGVHEPSYDDCYIIREVCKTVSLRAAKLAAAGKNKTLTLSVIEVDHVFFVGYITLKKRDACAK